MTIHLFNAKQVARELARKEIGPKARGYYILASLLLFTPFYYSGFMWANPLWSWLSIYEAFVVIVVTFIGFTKSFEAAGGENNPDFIAEFTCLYVPVSLTTILAIWSSFWVVTIGLRESITSLSESNLQLAQDLSRLGSDFFGLLSFLAVALVQVVTFYRITKLFYVVRGHSS